MGEERRLSIILDDDMADVIDDAVATRGYASSDEVVAEALAEWHRHRIETLEDAARLKQLIEEGLASGDGGDVNDAWFDDIKRRGRARIASVHRAA